MTPSPTGTAGSLKSASDFFTKAQQTLREARNAGATPLGQSLLKKGADLMNGPAFDTLPEQARENLAVLYSEAFQRVHGSLIA